MPQTSGWKARRPLSDNGVNDITEETLRCEIEIEVRAAEIFLTVWEWWTRALDIFQDDVEGFREEKKMDENCSRPS